MITEKLLKIYKEYAGDWDGWVRATQFSEMTDDDWSLIEGLLQDIALDKKRKLSVEYSMKLIESIKAHCDNERTIDLLKSMSIK